MHNLQSGHPALQLLKFVGVSNALDTWSPLGETKDSTLVPKYNVPIRTIGILDDKIYICNTEGGLVQQEEAEAILASIGNTDAFCKWLFYNSISWFAFNFFSAKGGQIVSSNSIVPLLVSYSRSPGIFCALDRWNMPPIKYSKTRQVSVAKGENLDGISQYFYDDVVYGMFSDGAFVIPKNSIDVWLHVPGPVPSTIWYGNSTWSQKIYNPVQIPVAPPVISDDLCSNGSGACPLCRILPGTVVMRWENCVAVAEPQASPTPRPKDNPINFPEKWRIGNWIASVIDSYVVHGWEVIIGTNYMNLPERNFFVEDIIASMLTNKIKYSVIARNPGHRKRPDKVEEIAQDEILLGKSVICYDSNLTTLTALNAYSVSRGVRIASVYVSTAETRMVPTGERGSRMINGIIVAPKL